MQALSDLEALREAVGVYSIQGVLVEKCGFLVANIIIFKVKDYQEGCMTIGSLLLEILSILLI